MKDQWDQQMREETGWTGFIAPTRARENGPMIILPIPLDGYMAEVCLPLRLTKEDAERVCRVIKAYAFQEDK